MLVTPHFSTDEFACHDTARTPYPPEWVELRLRPLCEQLEAIRTIIERPLHVDSGYRTEAYNRSLVGSAPNSQHCQGRAADIVVPDGSVTPAELHAVIHGLWEAGTLRIGGLGRYPTFVHVDIRPMPTGHLAQWSGARMSNHA